MRERTELQRLELRISDLQQLNEAMKKATDRNATDLTYVRPPQVGEVPTLDAPCSLHPCAHLSVLKPASNRRLRRWWRVTR